MGGAEEKKAEDAVNKLRKLPDNKRCANCLEPGHPLLTAVVMPFKIFVCSTCKSAHQSFSHRSKSTQMSVWTMEEVASLEDKNGGGNRAAQERYFADVRPEDRPREGDNLERFKSFVQRAYIDKKWMNSSGGGDRSRDDRDSRNERSERSERRDREDRDEPRNDSRSSRRDPPPQDARAPAALAPPSSKAVSSNASSGRQSNLANDMFDPDGPPAGSKGNSASLDFDPNAGAKSRVADDGFDPNMGASSNAGGGNSNLLDFFRSERRKRRGSTRKWL